ncbi:hypothetical protein B0H66DRAFT_597710 [Apodospora peruviana]|uniref:RRM domain-containing protein n=1 Tax=Apodospora peruviana TaxID=516989 RepID=A0AAE0IRW4_9PEZI|nr:hypothetical protein B0H66DRAFT_597710 [Apodospora peruviana]
MAYPGSPGASSNASSHPSLPPRPPTSKLPGFKPAFSAAPPTYSISSTPSYPSVTTLSYSAAPSYGAPPQTSSYIPHPSVPAVGGPHGGYNQTSPYSYPQQGYPQQGHQQQPPYSVASNLNTNNYSTPPQIRNPFPAPYVGAQASESNDPEMQAQIAQWQSAYMPRDLSAQEPKGPGPGTGPGARFGAANAYPQAQPVVSATAEAFDTSAAAAAAADEKKKTVYREGGGKKWQDDSLLEWDPSHLRLFVGNLAGETTDDSLLKAFSRWKSLQKAKVVRDKRTTKSKGFGFVSFSDPDDFYQAAKEMNGKYIQSHPVVVHKAKTEIKPQVVNNRKDDKRRKKHNSGHRKNGGSSGSGMGGNDGGQYEPHLGATGGGVTKPGQKTRGGLKLLG